MPFPLELVTLIGSTALGGLMKIWSQAIEAKRLERAATIEALSLKAGIVKEARQYENRGFQWTRRVIALTAVFFIIAFPKIVAVWMPEVAVHVGYPQLAKGFWFFTSDADKVVWHEVKGRMSNWVMWDSGYRIQDAGWEF